jgi:hypothetical protein
MGMLDQSNSTTPPSPSFVKEGRNTYPVGTKNRAGARSFSCETRAIYFLRAKTLTALLRRDFFRAAALALMVFF